jgi:hypothetical protein
VVLLAAPLVVLDMLEVLVPAVEATVAAFGFLTPAAVFDLTVANTLPLPPATRVALIFVFDVWRHSVRFVLVVKENQS